MTAQVCVRKRMEALWAVVPVSSLRSFRRILERLLFSGVT
jgi:hypothetical protein